MNILCRLFANLYKLCVSIMFISLAPLFSFYFVVFVDSASFLFFSFSLFHQVQSTSPPQKQGSGPDVKFSPPQKQRSGPDDPPAKKLLWGNRRDSRVRVAENRKLWSGKCLRSLRPAKGMAGVGVNG